MTNRTGLFLALGLVMGLGISVATAGNRPTADNAFLSLNGEVSRDLNAGGGGFPLADGGGLSFQTLDAGIACNTLATGGVFELHCDSAGHFCPWGDGGCSAAIGSQAYGKPINASVPTAPAAFYFATQAGAAGTTRLVCVTPATGDATMTCAVFRLY